MENLKQRIIEFYKDHKTEEELFEDSMSIARTISLFAHYKQVRENGETYADHPYRVAENFMRLITLPIEGKTVPQEIVDSFNIPTLGVFEVCLLHDVIEDTEVTLEDIEELYRDEGLESGFNKFIKEPLSLITHNKEESYDTYISKVLTNKTASLVKMLDMVDNTNMLGLRTLSSKELERSQKYLYYIKLINDKYNFLENSYRARNAYQDTLYNPPKN